MQQRQLKPCLSSQCGYFYDAEKRVKKSSCVQMRMNSKIQMPCRGEASDDGMRSGGSSQSLESEVDDALEQRLATAGLNSMLASRGPDSDVGYGRQQLNGKDAGQEPHPLSNGLESETAYTFFGLLFLK